jgi:hypothetical protein
MKSIFWLCVGIVIGVFLPIPYADQVRAWVLKIWSSVSGIM